MVRCFLTIKICVIVTQLNRKRNMSHNEIIAPPLSDETQHKLNMVHIMLTDVLTGYADWNNEPELIAQIETPEMLMDLIDVSIHDLYSKDGEFDNETLNDDLRNRETNTLVDIRLEFRLFELLNKYLDTITDIDYGTPILNGYLEKFEEDHPEFTEQLRNYGFPDKMQSGLLEGDTLVLRAILVDQFDALVFMRCKNWEAAYEPVVHHSLTKSM